MTRISVATAALGLSIAAAVLAAAALVVSAVGTAGIHRQPATAASGAAGATVVAIGDSIMGGHGLEPSQAWPAVVAGYNGWHLVNLSTDGAGFVAKGDDGSLFSDQVQEAVELDPSMVLISGSSNDLGVSESEVQASMISAMRTLRHDLPHTRIVAVSPVWNENEPPAQLDEINDDMEAAVASVGGAYIDIGTPLLNKPGFMQSDDGHPTAGGQLAIAAAVQQALRAKRVV